MDMADKDETTRQDFAPVEPPPSNGSPDPAKEDLNGSDLNGSDLELGPRATYITTGAAAGITQEHREYGFP